MPEHNYWWPLPLLSPQHEYRMLGLLLLALHLALWLEPVPWAARPLMGAHFLLFLLWQPWCGMRNTPSWPHLGLFLGLAAAFLILFNPWLGLLWKFALLSLLGGREMYRPRDRLANLSALLFLILSIFLLDMNELLPVNLYKNFNSDWVYLGLSLPLLLLLTINADSETENRVQWDFFHALVLSLLIALISFGSLLSLYVFGLNYPLAVLANVLAFSLFLLLVGWLWVAFAGIDGIGQLWTRQLLYMDNSFEQWLAGLTQPGSYKNLNPEQFLRSALEQLLTIPWISGLGWRSPYGEGWLGHEDKYAGTFNIQSLEITVYAKHPLRGMYYAHVKLLLQLLEHFHQAKRREEMFSQQAHLKAVHETGAKLTHDIKNLLQSLHAITSAMQACRQPEQFGETQRLLQGQLPHLSQRLQRTLDKLKQPDQPSYTNVPIRAWWDNLRARYRKREVDFSMSIIWNATVPEELFDNVVENLLENALNKRRRETGLRIHVALATSEGRVRLTVCDDGSAVPPEVEKHLLNEPVNSRDGFGIGLYQVAKQAIQGGYRLNLTHNMAGQVCFELSSV